MTELSPLTSFPQTEASPWISAYHQARLLQKDEATVDAYLRILRQFTAWVIARPGHGKQFRPEQLTRTVVEVYLSTLQEQGYSQGLTPLPVLAHLDKEDQFPVPGTTGGVHPVSVVVLELPLYTPHAS